MICSVRCIIALGSLLLAATAQANTIVYSDTTTNTGFVIFNGGATVVQGFDTTIMVADDINVLSGYAGATINSFSFSVYSLNTAAVTASTNVWFYSNDGAGGGPGTRIGSVGFGPITFASAANDFTFLGNGGTIFTVPASGTFWAGVTFDDNAGGSGTGSTGATAAQLNNLGQDVYAPPTVGNSGPIFFKTFDAVRFLGDNPAGYSNILGLNLPPGDLYWSFSSTTVLTSEPSTGLLALVAAAFILRRVA